MLLVSLLIADRLAMPCIPAALSVSRGSARIMVLLWSLLTRALLDSI